MSSPKKTSRQTSKQNQHIEQEKKKLNRNNNKSFLFDEKRIIITSGSTGPFVSLVLCCRVHTQSYKRTRSSFEFTFVCCAHTHIHTQNPVRANNCAFVMRRNINISPLRNTRFQFT